MGIGINMKWIIIYLCMLGSLYIGGIMVYRYLRAPVRQLGKFILSAALGAVGISVLNLLLEPLGFSLRLNVFNLGFIGLFGFVGAGTLFILRLIL